MHTLALALLLGCPSKSADRLATPPPVGDTATDDTPTDDTPTDDTDADTDADSDADADADADADSDADTDTDTDTGLPYVPADPLGDAPLLSVSALDDIAAAIDDVLDNTSYVAGVMIVDADNGQLVYASDEDLLLKPASNTKMFTTALAFATLGEEHRLRTAAWGNAAPNAAGHVDTLTVVVEHDFSWSSWLYADEYFAADRLADQLYDAGLRSVDTLVLAGEVVVEGYQFGTLDVTAHRADGRDVMEDALLSRGIDVDAATTSSSFAGGSVLLAERFSPPLHVVDHPLNVFSHNEFADLHLRHDGWVLRGDSSYAGGEAELLDWLDQIGVDTTGMNFNDGSGLSHGNQVTARSIVDLQLAMLEDPSGLAWERTMSTGGVEGTLASRLTATDTVGRVFGKTGTLSDTIATSGILYSRHDGHRYVFGIVFNEVTNQTTARSYCDEIIYAFASDRRGLGARPAPPALRSVINRGDGTLVARWDAVAGADTYGVWVSDDGAWRRADALTTDDTELVIGGYALDAPVFVRVTAINAQGSSEPSDTYGATPSLAPSRVLVVDGNDRWDALAENTKDEGHDSVMTVGRAIVGRPFDSVDNDAWLAGDVDLADYDAVIWTLGEESTDDATFDADERDGVDSYLAGGGSLLVSGAEIGWDLDYLGDAAMQSFYADALKASYVSDDAGTYTAVPRDGGLFDGVGELGFYTPGAMDVLYPDVIAPVGGAVTEIDYWGGAAGAAAVSYAGAHHVVHFGFPLESVDSLAQREALIDRSLDFFGL